VPASKFRGIFHANWDVLQQLKPELVHLNPEPIKFLCFDQAFAYVQRHVDLYALRNVNMYVENIVLCVGPHCVEENDACVTYCRRSETRESMMKELGDDGLQEETRILKTAEDKKENNDK